MFFSPHTLIIALQPLKHFDTTSQIPTQSKTYWKPSKLTTLIMASESFQNDGTCRIYYKSLDRAPTTYSDLPKPDAMANVRTVEFHFNMQPDTIANRTRGALKGFHSTVASFMRECPIWHFANPTWYFANANDMNPKPAVNIIVEHHGLGDIAYHYETMLKELVCLMAGLSFCRFENVSVELRPKYHPGDSRPCFPSDASVDKLKSVFEKVLGTATVVGHGDECRMEFRPQNLDIATFWSGNQSHMIFLAVIDPCWSMNSLPRGSECEILGVSGLVSGALSMLSWIIGSDLDDE